MTDSAKPLAGAVAWVTGGASGIGRAIARRLAGQGARVGVLDLDGAAAEAVGAELGGAGAACDVADEASVAAAAKALEAQLGPPDILVNAAGIAHRESVAGHSEKGWQRVLAVNLTGSFHLMREVLGGMIARRRGRVVNISSGTGVRVGAGSGAYGASKAGVIALTRAAANEAAPSCVTVNAVAPGLVDTPMTRKLFGDASALGATAQSSAISNPMGIVLEPDDIAHAVAFLCHPDSRGITGQVLHVNAGALMP